MIKQKVSYKGKVDISYMRNGREINSSTHNTGLPDMALLFAKAVSGNLDQTNDIPRLLDIGYIIPGTITSRDSSGIWTSILNNPVDIGGRQFSFDNSLNNWVSTLIATVYYTDLNGGILDDILTLSELPEDDPDKIQLKIRLCSYNKINRKYLAEINVGADDIRKIKDLTSAIITWYSELLYEEDNSSDVYDMDIVGSN